MPVPLGRIRSPEETATVLTLPGYACQLSGQENNAVRHERCSPVTQEPVTSEDSAPREVCFLHLLSRSRAYLGRALRGLAVEHLQHQERDRVADKVPGSTNQTPRALWHRGSERTLFQQAAAFVWLLMRQPLSEPFGNTIMIARGKQTHQNKCK